MMLEDEVLSGGLTILCIPYLAGSDIGVQK